MGYWPSVRSKWLAIGHVLFLRVYRLRQVHKLAKKDWGQQAWSIKDYYNFWSNEVSIVLVKSMFEVPVKKQQNKLVEWKAVVDNAGFVCVLKNLEKPWISGVRFQGLESTWISFSVLESPWFFIEQDRKSSENKCSGKQRIMLWKCNNLCFRSQCSFSLLSRTFSYKCTAHVRFAHVF